MNLKFENVTISFDTKPVLDQFSFEVKEGEKVVVSGDSASGKSTIINLVLGFCNPDSGRILIDGEDIRDMNIHKWRSRIGWLPQEFPFGAQLVRDVIFRPFSFKSNKLVKPTDEEILVLFSKLGLEESALSKKMDEVSGGQKQRIGLIISLLLKRDVLLLDEPTAALDKHNKKLVMAHLLKNKHSTILSTSHDQEWIDQCDKIIKT